jgi:flagellar M-ring protein FliF
MAAAPNATALAPNPAGAYAEPSGGYGQRVSQLPGKSKMMLAIGIAALIALAVASQLWMPQGDYKVLFANLSDKDGGAILAQLSQMNIPYKHAEGGGAILVPADKVHDARLKLASQGLPKGGNVGLDLMDNQKFGVTQFQEQVNYQRGLEGELAKSIQSLSAVQSARIHLALPKQSVFLREQQKPSASVLVALYPGRTLDRAQVAGIVHLVSSSVPDLAPKAVSVLDQNGTLISGPQDGSTVAQLDPTQLNYVREIEESLGKRVLDIVEPIVGRGNVRAQINSDIDFSQVESTAEIFTPNQGADTKQAVRSQSVAEALEKGNATPTGVPGAMSNSPPTPPTAPITGGSGAPQSAAAAAGNGKREAITNYEIDKTVRRTRNQTGVVKRLSAAVVVNQKKTVDTAGKVTYTPLSEAEVAQIQALVREAIGFNKDRGDSVNVVNAPFSEEPATPPVATPWWQDPSNIAIAKDAGRAGAFLLAILIVVFGVIRPVLKQIEAGHARKPAGADADMALPPPETYAALPSPTGNRRVEQIRDMAKQDPATVANVVRQWVGSNG